MNIITSFRKAIIFWLKNLFARFRSSGDGFAQVPVVVFLALMALALPVVVMLTKQRQDTRSNARGGELTRPMWGRVFEGKRMLGKDDGVRIEINQTAKGIDWKQGNGGDGRQGWMWKKDVAVHNDYQVSLVPPAGYDCSWQRVYDDNRQSQGDGCEFTTSHSTSGTRIYFTLKPTDSQPPVSSCDCSNPQDEAKAQAGDFDCSGTVGIGDFSAWVASYLSSDNQDLDCNSKTPVVEEFGTWLTGYLNLL